MKNFQLQNFVKFLEGRLGKEFTFDIFSTLSMLKEQF